MVLVANALWDNSPSVASVTKTTVLNVWANL